MAKKVLMIDDDEEICEEMSEILKDEGYDVSLAFNGLEGLKLIESGAFDLVLLDLKIPGMSGYDILRNVKSRGSGPKVIVISGRPFIKKYLPGEDTSDKQKKEEVLKMADGFINKPFDIM
ncbi:MAG: response regulator transcription factor, partial [Endomicrobiales bacterium]